MPGYKLISSDSHLNEVPATWERVQSKHGERAPRIVWNPSEQEAGPYLVVNGTDGFAFKEDCAKEYVGLLVGGLTETGRSSAEGESFSNNFRFENYPAPGMDPAARIKDMDRDGIEAEILFASHVRHMYELSAEDEPFFHDIAESYNEWMMEYVSHNPTRLVAQPALSVLNPAGAAADLRAYARRGAKGFMIASSVPAGMSYGDPMFDPLWEAAQECDVPLAMHSSSGRWKQPPYGHARARSFIGPQGEVQVTLVEMIYGGIFDRFPRLKIVSAEFEIGWVGFTMQRARTLDVPRAEFAEIKRLGLKHTPAEYLERNVWFTFENDRAGCLTIPTFGEDNYLWASDYPHGVTTWPESHATVDRQFEGLSEDIKRKVVRQNAISLYNLNLAS